MLNTYFLSLCSPASPLCQCKFVSQRKFHKGNDVCVLDLLLCGDVQQLFTIFCKITKKWQLSHHSDGAFSGHLIPVPMNSQMHSLCLAL